MCDMENISCIACGIIAWKISVDMVAIFHNYLSMNEDNQTKIITVQVIIAITRTEIDLNY